MINIMNEYITFSTNCIDKYMKYIFGDYYKKEIFDKYLETYIENRYSNYVGDNDRKTVSRNLSKAFADVTKELEEKEEKSFLRVVEKLYKNVYSLDQLYFLAQQKKVVNEINEIRIKDLKIEDDKFLTTFNVMLNEDIKKRKGFLDEFLSDTFNLKFKKIMKDKNLQKVEIENKIKFPNLYSKEAIVKTAEKAIINEDLTLILYTMLCAKIIQDLVDGDYSTMYYVDFPRSVFDKKTKISRMLTVLDNQYIHEKVRLVIDFDCFMRYRTYVFELMRQGFFFCIFLDDSFDYSSENLEYLVTFDKILMLDGKYYSKDMRNNGKIKDKILIVDEVI